MYRPFLLALSIFAVLSSSLGWAKRTCISPADALQHLNQDVCVEAHIYRAVDAGNEIHFLDVCSPQTSDADCRFFIFSFSKDRKSVNFLHSLVGRTIHIRGTVHTIQERGEIELSSERQLHGGKGRFRPNPLLVKSFSAENGGQGFIARNGTLGQRGVHFHHRGN